MKMATKKDEYENGLIQNSIKRKGNDESSVSTKKVCTNESMAMFFGRDTSYPTELNKLIHPMQCDVCVVNMNSLIMAKDHYQSRAHDRKLTNWLQVNYVNKGLEAPEIKRFLIKATNETKTGPDAYYCEHCDLKLTSLLHAQQHYGGRKHKQVLTKLAKPGGVGYLDEITGKWVRTATKITPKVANDGRFGIGESFKQLEIATNNNTTTETPTTVEKKTTTAAVFRCNICDITVTSESQLALHENGAKHIRKLKLSSMDPNASIQNVPTTTDNSLYKSLFEPEQDFSNYRTPTGAFYCKTCNLNIEHVAALEQHLIGKKHLKRLQMENSLKKS